MSATSEKAPQSAPRACWCGHTVLETFGADYLRCPACQSLVSTAPADVSGDPGDDRQGFYGRSYYEKLTARNGQPALRERMRRDLPERDLYWLRYLLQYKAPPAAALEIGCAHGGFVALLQLAGYQARGLEMSGEVADLAGRTFNISVQKGRLEEQRLERSSLDVVALLDVIEHLPDPVAFLGRCREVLRADGVLMIQTPDYPADATYSRLVERQSAFLKQLMPDQHIHLFSRAAAQALLRRAGFPHLRFEPAIFAHYDMFLFASARPLAPDAPEAIAAALLASAGGRMVQAMLDLDDQRLDLARQNARLKADVEHLITRVRAAESPRREPARPVASRALAKFRASIDHYIKTQPNRDLLAAIRRFNHEQLDALHRTVSLKDQWLLDIGASPHGFALERALKLNAAVYIGVGLDVTAPARVTGKRGQTGWLLKMDAADLRLPDHFFDLVVSFSTFEHAADPHGVLNEIARVLRPGGRALITFEPVWTCSYGHHLHHFGHCAQIIEPWAHLRWSPEEMRRRLAPVWPPDAPLTLAAAIDWTYHGTEINRQPIAAYRQLFQNGPLTVEWMLAIPDENPNPAQLRQTAEQTGISPEDLCVRGLSVMLHKPAP